MPATPAWPPKSAPRLFVSGPLAIDITVAIDGPQAHYLTRVMRTASGDCVILCDDETGEWAAEAVDVGKRGLSLRCVTQLRTREAVPDFWLCPALLKKDRFDLVLEKACELGVAQIRPVLTRRCVADRINPDRVRATLVEAAEQCARTALPTCAAPVTLAALLAQWPEGRTLYFADETGGAPAAQSFARSGPAGLLIGPEGGFDPAERDAIRAHRAAVPITLGPRVLRGETAAIAACALWMGIAGDWAGPRE
ncbi:16S rRNA (uracil(1498)-N(3))-methyltransferase [Novosphingobium sp.]|uniref:16S rRNA (uracil(1498)-N(3))-methyltransferase n=1 Tax=Novosphingobium sp. TaxID=1874826 RepID=UPI003B52820F